MPPVAAALAACARRAASSASLRAHVAALAAAMRSACASRLSCSRARVQMAVRPRFRAVAAASAGDAQCELSGTQVGVVQSVLQERNASCSYNMTVDEILGM